MKVEASPRSSTRARTRCEERWSGAPLSRARFDLGERSDRRTVMMTVICPTAPTIYGIGYVHRSHASEFSDRTSLEYSCKEYCRAICDVCCVVYLSNTVTPRHTPDTAFRCIYAKAVDRRPSPALVADAFIYILVSSIFAAQAVRWRVRCRCRAAVFTFQVILRSTLFRLGTEIA